MNSYAGRRVLVTGGLGFIGSNLALRLVQLGASVTIVDSLVKGCGGDRRNIDPVAGRVEVIDADIGDAGHFALALRQVDTVFNLAGEVSHTRSMEFPEHDLTLNTASQVIFLEECAKRSKGVRVVYTGTTQVYGRPQKLPVNELHPVAPLDFNGVHRHATELYHLMLTRTGALDAVVLRLSNIYGPRQAIHKARQGFLSGLFLNAATGQPLQVFGDGAQLRDPLYIDDAVSALVRAGERRPLKSRVYNVAGCEALSLGEIARTLCCLAGVRGPNFGWVPPDQAPMDTGSFVSDTTLIRRELGWMPATSFEDGAIATLRYLRTNIAGSLEARTNSSRSVLNRPRTLIRRAGSQ